MGAMRVSVLMGRTYACTEPSLVRIVWFCAPTWLVTLTFEERLGSPMNSIFSVGVWPDEEDE